MPRIFTNYYLLLKFMISKRFRSYSTIYNRVFNFINCSKGCINNTLAISKFRINL